MALDPKLLEILACPEDKGPLLYFADEDTLYNPRLTRRYRVLDGDIPDLLIDDAETVDDAEARPAHEEGRDRRREADVRTAEHRRRDGLAELSRRGRRVCPNSSRPRTKPRRWCTTDALPEAPSRSATSSCWAWAARVSPAMSSSAAFNDEVPVPITVLKQIRTPAFVGPDTLAFAMSYSGDDRRDGVDGTTARPRRARRSSPSRAAASSKRIALDSGGVHIACPTGLPATRRNGRVGSAAVHRPLPHRVRAGRARDVDARADAARASTRSVPPGGRGCGEPGTGARAPDRPHDPADLRRRRNRRDRGVPLEVRHQREREGAAFSHAYPELDHNEICAWGQHGDVTRQLIDARRAAARLRARRALRLRFDATREIIDECVHQVLDSRRRGRRPPRASCSTSCTWATGRAAISRWQNDVDPGPDRQRSSALKDRMAQLP